MAARPERIVEMGEQAVPALGGAWNQDCGRSDEAGFKTCRQRREKVASAHRLYRWRHNRASDVCSTFPPRSADGKPHTCRLTQRQQDQQGLLRAAAAQR